jgi:hypothetical protein
MHLNCYYQQTINIVMLAYYELFYNDTNQISLEVNNYLINETALLYTQPVVPWNFLNRDSILKFCPSLNDFFKIYKLIPRDLSVTICHEDLKLHYDSPPVVAKINFPILNTKNTVNRWYSISDDDYRLLPQISDPFGNLHEDITNFPKEQLTLFAEYYDMANPIVFHSRIPHEVILLENSITPRIVLSCTFHNEPIHYLQ